MAGQTFLFNETLTSLAPLVLLWRVNYSCLVRQLPSLAPLVLLCQVKPSCLVRQLPSVVPLVLLWQVKPSCLVRQLPSVAPLTPAQPGPDILASGELSAEALVSLSLGNTSDIRCDELLMLFVLEERNP